MISPIHLPLKSARAVPGARHFFIRLNFSGFFIGAGD